jgi:hypothetical protein
VIKEAEKALRRNRQLFPPPGGLFLTYTIMDDLYDEYVQFSKLEEFG